MKKYIVIIILIGIILGGVLTYNTIKVENENNKTFKDSGYVLQSMQETEQSVERYYFNSNEIYKTKFDKKVVFNNTEGEEVSTNKTNFIHYSDGSISAFTNGVLLDLNNIEADPITYYNIMANDILKKSGENYTISNLDQTLKFKNLIWKIDTNKYIIISNDIKLVFGEEKTNTIKGYVELEYLDNEIVKIYNQETTYQTISSNAYIDLPDEIRVNLGKRIVSKSDENKMSLENMVIDSDDNITIVDLDEEEQKQTEEGNTIGENEIKNNQTVVNNNSSNSSNNSGSTIVNGSGNNSGTGNGDTSGTGNDDGNTGNIGNSNTPIAVKKSPKYMIESLDVKSTGFNASITIEDEDNTLVSDSKVYVLENSTGKTVYQYVETLGVYGIQIEVASLKPDTEYTLVVESSYSIEGVTYTKNFIYKIFRTSVLGIEIEKDVLTDSSIGVALDINKDSKIKSVDVVISDMSGKIIETKTININESDTSADKKELVEFENLTSNTEYTIGLTNILYDGQILVNSNIEGKIFKTLKKRPVLSGTAYEINKRDGNFKLSLSNVEDIDKGIQKYKFLIYDTRSVTNNEPVKELESSTPEVTLQIDEETISRNVGYTFKVVAEFYDNEKYFTYASELSNVFTMDGVEFPTIRFEETDVTFERIQGTIRIEDNGNTIDEENNEFTITYTNSIGDLKTFTSIGSYDIPVNVNNLRSNETYKFAVYTKVDLQDGNDPIEECYIGGFIVQTKTPNNMVAEFNGEDDVQNAFSVKLQLKPESESQGTLEPETLTGLTVSIYPGQTPEGEYPTGSPIRTMKLIDTNLNAYESDLKDRFFDNAVSITPEFFNAGNGDFKDAYYTITVTNAYDYTDYSNKLPILNNVFTVETNGYMPDLPTDPENAVIVTPIRNYTQQNSREDLNDDTIVGYSIKPVYDNTGAYARKVIYKAYDANTNTLIKEIELEIGNDGAIPKGTFNVFDGTEINIVDTDELRRGNSYYFTYEMYLDLNNDGETETKYPTDDIVLKSKIQTPEKQEPTLYWYPTISSESTISFKYKFNDVDCALGNNNQVTAKIDNSITSKKELEETGTEYKEITFENLKKGTFSIVWSKCLVKLDGMAEDKILTQYFEGNNSISELTYSVDYDATKLSINFSDSKALDYITGVRVELMSIDNPEINYIKDFLTIPSNNIINISYNGLGKLLKTRTQVKVYAYYDSGITGFETDAKKYITLQQAYENKGDNIYYYDIDKSSNLIPDTEAMGNMYNATRNNNIITLENVVTGIKSTIELTYSNKGLLYKGNVILQKQIDEMEVTCEGDNIIYFDKIIPSISLLDDKNQWQLFTEIDNLSLKADVIIDESATIKNDEIYIDLYQTDSEYREEKFIKTITVKSSEFADTIKITGLDPKSYYFIKFRTILQSDGEEEELYLYDVDYQVSGRSYYFSTLADVGIDNIKITEKLNSYEEKNINISYTLEKTTGYDRIEYKIYHFDKATQEYVEVMQGIEVDKIFNNKMNKEIPINPGSEFVFGDTYKLEIIPIAEYTDLHGEQQVLELGKKEQEFKFNKLSNPTIAISGSREFNQIVFKVTIYDDDKVVVGNNYSIKIFDGSLQDITPEEYANKTFSVDILNNSFILNNVENAQSYTILVETKTDRNNKGDEESYSKLNKTYEIPAINESGISVGNVTASKNTSDPSKIDLIFNNSYRLTDIEAISYSIYNTSGYSQSSTKEFVPIQITSGDENYYKYTLAEGLVGYGKYYVELQFIKEDEVVETVSLEYIYLES